MVRAMVRRKERIATADNNLIDQAEALVRSQRALVRTKLPRWKELAPEAQAHLVDALLSRGIEVGAKGALRVPLREQATSLVQGGARVPWKGAQKRIAGATTKDRDAALAEALGPGPLRLVVRTKVDTVVGGREDVLTPDELERLVKAHEALGSVLKLVRKKVAPRGPLASVQKTLLREDAAGLLAQLSVSSGGDRKRLSQDGAREAMVDRIRQMEQPPVLLVWVPDLVKSLAPLMTAEQARDALLAARQRGLVELRPESGVGRLSSEDAALCPRDGAGIPLSHVRLLSTR